MTTTNGSICPSTCREAQAAAKRPPQPAEPRSATTRRPPRAPAPPQTPPARRGRCSGGRGPPTGGSGSSRGTTALPAPPRPRQGLESPLLSGEPGAGPRGPRFSAGPARVPLPHRPPHSHGAPGAASYLAQPAPRRSLARCRWGRWVTGCRAGRWRRRLRCRVWAVSPAPGGAGGGFPRSRRCARAVPRPAPRPAFSVTCALPRVETSDRPQGLAFLARMFGTARLLFASRGLIRAGRVALPRQQGAVCEHRTGEDNVKKGVKSDVWSHHICLASMG